MVRTICHTIYPDTKIIVSRDPHFVQVPLFLSCSSRQCHNRHEQWQLIQAPARPKAQCGAYDCTVKPWFCGRVCSASYSILTVVMHYNHLQQFCKFYFTLSYHCTVCTQIVGKRRLREIFRPLDKKNSKGSKKDFSSKIF